MWLSYRSGEDELCGLSLCVCAQLFPTLCDPVDCTLPGCSVHGIFPGKNTGVDCHFLFQVLFLTQELNLSLQHLLHWHTDSLPLSYLGNLSSVQFSRSVMSDSLWPHGLPGLPLHHQLLEFTQTHVHWVGDAIQSFHPLLSPSHPTFNVSQNQGLFKWVSSSHQVAKVLEFQL